MSSLTQLLHAHGSLLILDAASTEVQVGLLRTGCLADWSRSTDEAGRSIFKGTKAVLQAASQELEDVGAFVFCAGPGSMLGIRTVAMALRTWQVLKPRPIYSYQSLAVAGYFVWGQTPGRALTVIADARRDTWHHQAVAADGRLSALQRLPAAALPEGDLFTPGNFRSWSPPPRPATVISYDLAQIFPRLGEGDFFHAAESPDAFQHEAPEYQKWSARIHQPAATAKA
jgi:tRNA threonylcarbamoyladenosine biosynthesis protein TsaB